MDRQRSEFKPPGSARRVPNMNLKPYKSFNLYSLRSSYEPRFVGPEEIATYSTTLKDPGRINADRDEVNNIPEHWRGCTATSTCMRTLHEDPTAHRMVFSTPNDCNDVDFNLYYGYGTETTFDDKNEYLNVLLECLKKKMLIGDSEFVCSRGLLTEIGLVPYGFSYPDKGMKIFVQKFGKVYYMCKFPLDGLETTDNVKKKEYGGRKFESYVTAKPGQPPDTDSPLNYNNEFHSVVRSEIGTHSLIYRCEIDCCDPDDQKQYMELKSTGEFSNDKKKFRRNKLIRWWLQSYLAGVKKVFCGVRNNQGIVTSCGHFVVSKVPGYFASDEPNTSVCLASIDSFLKFVKTCKFAQDFDVYVFTRKSGEKKITAELDESRKERFLPYWFVKDLIQGGNA